MVEEANSAVEGGASRLTSADREQLRRALSSDLPTIPTHFLYDDVGSDLFEQITEQPEYYQTRTELGILESQADRIVADLAPRQLAELGSGAGRKVGLLVEAMHRGAGCDALTLFDVNGAFLRESVQTIGDRYPGVEVRGVVGRFHHDLNRLGPGGARLITFFGSTIGNFPPEQTVPFLRRLAGLTGPDDSLLIGFDLVKDVATLDAAYNDVAGITAAFNLNILRGFNRAADADFDPDAFEHVAFYDVDHQWIEMRLRATRAVSVRVGAVDLDLSFAPGDELRTEISCKYTRPQIQAFAAESGLTVRGWYTDPQERFALVAFVRS